MSLTHLATANRIRLARAEVKRQVKAGDLAIADVFADHLTTCRNMTIGELLCAQHRWGKTRSRKLLAAAGLTEAKRLGSMTTRQRLALLNELERRK